MFDISWSELLILAVVTLIFVGPKELPKFLATIGRYVGAVRRHANDFRQVFDQAMREAEVDQMRRDVESVRDDVKQSIRDANRLVAEPVVPKAHVAAKETVAALPGAAAEAQGRLLPSAGDAMADAAEAEPQPSSVPGAEPPVPGKAEGER